MAPMSQTAAIIVTFNRSAKLLKVLDALDRQTQRPDIIVVIDNASTDDTTIFMKKRSATDPSLQYRRLPKNIGGAGGFNVGLKAAYNLGADFFWISDDDAYPNPDALEKLNRAIITFEADNVWKPSFACSRVEWVDGTLCEMNTPRPVWDWPRFLSPAAPWALVDSASFVSVLIPRWAVIDHGLPIADYFIWFDDAEYTRRLARSYPGLFVADSVVVHDTPDNRGVNFCNVDNKSLWKFKYGARNESSFHRRERGILGVAAYAYRVRSQMRDGKISRKHQFQIFWSIFKGSRFRPAIEHV